MEWLRWALASLASAARADEPGSGECHQRVHARLPTRYARALMEWLRWPLALLASTARAATSTTGRGTSTMPSALSG
jgi:hypothetical protein